MEGRVDAGGAGGEMMLGWIGNAFIVAGLWGVGNKRRGAFILTGIGEVIWVVRAILQPDYALAAICIVFAVLAVRSYVRWGC